VRPLKSVFGVIGALVPIIYCGSLLYYFLDLGGSFRDVEAMGLGPTVLGLATVGLLFCIPLVIKIVRIFAGLRPPGSGGTAHDGEFDADAVIARYMARRSAEDAPCTPAAPPANKDGGAARRAGFGRKIR
jgi:hypothetical protein